VNWKESADENNLDLIFALKYFLGFDVVAFKNYVEYVRLCA